MSVSADIKDYLCTDSVKRSACCAAAFLAGKSGAPLAEECAACRQHYVAGVFVASGTITDPSKAFHLEIKAAEPIAAVLNSILTEEGLPPRMCAVSGGRVRLYYKVSSMISDFLTYIGAMKFALEVMEKEVIKNVRYKENRKSNAELANIDRAATAAAEQTRAIRLLREHGAFNAMSEELVLTAKLREENPFMPLGELCKVFSPPISKSGLSHRLKRIMEEADKLSRGV